MKRWIICVSILLIAAAAAFYCTFDLKAVIAMDDRQNQQNNPDGPSNGKTIALFIGSPIAMVNDREITVDPSNLQVVPFIENNSTLVPLRFIAENLGARVDWDAATSMVTVSAGGNVVSLLPGSSRIKINGIETGLDIPVQTINDRTFVPLRVLVEALDKKVFYDRGLIIVNDRENVLDKTADSDTINSLIAKLNNVPVVGSFDNLKGLLQQMGLIGYGGAASSESVGGVLTDTNNKAQAAKSVQSAPAAPSASDAGGSASNTAAGYSETNVQVEGVDEADIIKTDGEYIYQVNKQRIAVIKAYPADKLEVASIVTFEDKRFRPGELYLDGKNIIVIGTSYHEMGPEPMTQGQTNSQSVPPSAAQSSAQSLQKSVAPQLMPEKMPAYRYTEITTTKAIILDASNKNDIKKLREVEIEGNYISSRKIGSYLYLTANKSVPYYLLRSDPGKVQDDSSDPLIKSLSVSFRDTVSGDQFTALDYGDIRYFPGCVEPNYLVVAGLDLSQTDKKVNISAYLGSGQNIYVSPQNLYVSVTAYRNYAGIGKPALNVTPSIGIARPGILPWYEQSNETLVYKFGLNKDNITYIAKGTVPGTILNQFSMDEFNGSLRIATTKGYEWVTGENTSKNNIYVLDEMMNITGRLENIAPGEKIYSVRFMGEKGYVVTFKKVDPLFVLNLKDPYKPEILGSLKIPGYSDYLHPYDETHIIGFGKDTIEVPVKNSKGEVINTQAYYMGMKIAIFDVTDVNNPIEMFVEKIGDRGTDSELLRNHKALLFDKEKNLLAFPVTVMENMVKEPIAKEPMANTKPLTGGVTAFPQYGQFAFQGAYVYDISLEKGFGLKGKITHISDEEYRKAGNYWYNSDRNVERILYIGDVLYTLSQGMVKTNQMKDLQEIKAALIP